MPRLARLDALGVLHHVIIHGIERRNILEDNKDRDSLLKRLGELLPAAKTSCYKSTRSGVCRYQRRSNLKVKQLSDRKLTYLFTYDRPQLHLIRSLGGWEAVKRMRIGGQERVKGDQRILGDSGFVLDVLKEADEKFERRYEMKRLGYDLNTIEERVCEIYKVEKGDIFSRSREKVKSDARSLFCFWAVRKLGYGQRELARRLGMSQPGVGYAVIKGEAISKSNNYLIAN
jgi:hypothetical protein